MQTKCFVRKSGEFSSTNCVTFDCLDRKSLQGSVINFDKQLGAGFYGTVYTVVTKWGAQLALKVMNLNYDAINYQEAPEDEPEKYIEYLQSTESDRSDAYAKEVRNAKMASRLQIGPKVYDSWICNDAELRYRHEDDLSEKRTDSVGFILMDKITGMTYHDYRNTFPDEFQKNKEFILKSIQNKLQTLDYEGFWFGDLHGENVMLEFKHPSDVTNALLIDFSGLQPNQSFGGTKGYQSLDTLEMILAIG